MPRDEFTLELETRRFKRFTRALIRGMEQEGQKLALRKIAFDFLGRVIPRTPVDLGRARGGWTTYLLAQGQPAEVGGRSEAAVTQGRSEGDYKEKFTGAEQYILLINAVAYIVLLEFGSSDQAPAGMVRITMREMQMKKVAPEALREQLVAQIRKADIKAGRMPRAAQRRAGVL